MGLVTMNSNEENFPKMDPVPGEGILARKRFHNLQMKAVVFQQATNLQPPLDPPQPPVDPAQPPADTVIPKLALHSAQSVIKPRIVDITPRTGYSAPKDSEPDKLLC